jgi:anti-sigma-K factor RskA
MTQQNGSTLLPETTCTHPANDLIEPVAFGFATHEERRVVLNHVATCDICTSALRNAQFAAVVLPLSVSETDVELPDSVWAGIESRLGLESQAPRVQAIPPPTPISRARTAPFQVHWAVAAVLALLTLAGGILLGRTMFETDSDTPDQTVAQVTVTDPNLTASGTVEYVEEQGVVVLRMQDMPPAPQGYVYQVWVIDGDTPVSAGTMDPNTSGFATAADPGRYQTLAVTLEEGPVGSGQPTTDPIIVADLTPFGGD